MHGSQDPRESAPVRGAATFPPGHPTIAMTTTPSTAKARPFLLAIGAATLVAALAGCGEHGIATNAHAQPAMPPAEVGVVTVKPGPIGLVADLPGRLEASRVAQVRARATGILEKRLFTEGSDVKAGQPLFRVASAPYEAQLASAKAALARAEANENQAKIQVDRYRPLLQANAVSRQDFDNANSALKLAQADVASARAGVQTAQINLGYTNVTAPISGRIGRALLTEGALVSATEATPLATVQQVDPMYVNFTQSASEVFRLRREVESGKFKATAKGGASVRVLLDDGSAAPQPGTLLFADLTVDQTTGQVTLRAELPNPGGFLLPGMYVRVQLEQVQATEGILLPQQAVTRSASGDTVMVVSEAGQVAPRPVKVGSAQGNDWVVLDGLKAGEKVMVDGFQKLRGNAPVKPVEWKRPMPAAPAATNASPAASTPAKAGGAQ